MAGSAAVPVTDQDVRLQDYLDDKFQATADFETLDSLIENVRTQQDLLKKQVSLPA